MRKLKFKNQKGFTLIELLVTIAIIGVLAGVVLVAINPALRMAEARDAGEKNNVGQTATAMEAYFTRQSPVAYPDTVATMVTVGDLKRDPGTVTIVPAAISSAAHSAYADLEADVSAGCSGATPDAFWCYRTDTGVSGVICKAVASTPTATCQ